MSEADTAPESEVTEAVPKAPGKLSLALKSATGKAGNWFRSRQPRPFTTIVMLVGTAILLGLGTWQILRTQEKNVLLDHILQEFKQPATNLQTALPDSPEKWREMHYKPISLQGTWITPTYMLRLGPRVHEETVGYQLIMPLRLQDNQVILVNRGFMPEKMTSLPPPAGQIVVIKGVAYQPETIKSPYVPENVPSRDIWTWTDMTAMGHEVGAKDIVPVMIYEDRVSDRDSYPIGGQLPLPSHNRHWHYAVTWYALALALMVIWMITSNPKPKTVESTLADGQQETTDPVALRGLYPEATD